MRQLRVLAGCASLNRTLEIVSLYDRETSVVYRFL